MDPLRIMCVHGLGDHRDNGWHEDWRNAILAACPADRDRPIEILFETYDPIFEDIDISGWDIAKAVWKLASSAVRPGRERGKISALKEKVRWTAGYVVAWVEDREFQKHTRDWLFARLREHQPDVVIAHSLGSLVSYNAFSHPSARENEIADILSGVNYLTIGSQIGNPFVVGNLTHGRVTPLAVKTWRHFYNRHDDVFTAPIRLPDANNFLQIETPFDHDGVGDHSGSAYLAHAEAVDQFWNPLCADLLGKGVYRTTRQFGSVPAKSEAKSKPRKRAVLVGINDYPDEASRLDGCVNDVFLMSSVLQECGYDAADIHVCLDSRATTDGILERLEWLVDDPQPGDERIFYFSGHGAQIPEYGPSAEPDHHLECLVPWDFAWSAETGVTDKQIHQFYSQLPYEVQLGLIFDCCHAGSMHRDGGRRAKGISPPDDIRHREIRWDNKREMWVPRAFRPLNKSWSDDSEINRQYFGQDGSVARLGRGGLLRQTSARDYEASRHTPDYIPGPYLPLIIEACAENEYAYEYRHGVTSYGAFTYSLATLLRRYSGQTPPSFTDLVTQVRKQLVELNYDQTPQILGPSQVLAAPIPWLS